MYFRDVPPGVQVFGSFDDAMHFLCTPSISKGIETIWNAGGGQIYEVNSDGPEPFRST